MRSISKHLFVCCLLGLAACGGDATTEEPAGPGDHDDAATGQSRADAGRVQADAGKNVKADAAAADPGDPDAQDAGPTTPVDAGRGNPRDAATSGGAGDAGPVASTGETGRTVGMTAAHNAVRAMVMTSSMLPNMVWDDDVAAYARQWADMLAMTSCSSPRHRTGAELQKKGYGENLATFGATAGAGSTAQQAVNGWAAEAACWTYGTIAKTEKCDMTCYKNLHSDGCGHYTQVVWRNSTRIGCGVASCMAGQFKQDIWICNYSPAGNYVGQAPY